MSTPSQILPLLLPPSSLLPTPTTLPLLSSIQRLLNTGFHETHSLRPDIFGTNFTRLGTPEQVASLPGPHGFTIILVEIQPGGRATSEPDQGVGSGDGVAPTARVVATGSVVDFGTGPVEEYVQRAKKKGGPAWEDQRVVAARAEAARVRGDVGGAMALGSGAMGASARRDGAELDGGSAAAAGARGVETVEDEKVSKFEITAFAVDPDVQARGLGARVLEEIKWVTERGLYGGKLRGRMKDERVLSSVRLESQGKGGEVTGIDVDKLRRLEQEGTGNVLNGSEQHGNVDTDQPELVLTCVRELGTEQYYQRRGFKTVATGTVPAGMWGAKKECTWAYMEAGT